MPLVLELIVLMLGAYALGIAIGWVIWGTNLGQNDGTDDTQADDPEQGELP